MKLIRILESIMSEIGDLSAGQFPFKSKASTIRKIVKAGQEDLNQSAIRWRKNKHDPKGIKSVGKTSYYVTGESGIDYNIKIGFQIEYQAENTFTSWARVDFDVKGNKKDVSNTNAKEQYKLISTIVAAFIDFANAVEPLAPLTSATIYPKADDSQDHTLNSKRARLYGQYIKKNLDKLPGEWSIIESGAKDTFELTRKMDKPTKKK
jgi:hypothetical protein